jgi:hypothetical protein
MAGSFPAICFLCGCCRSPPHDVISAVAIPLACLGNWPYLERMAQPASTHPQMTAARPQGRVASMIVWSAAGAGALAVLGAAALWFHYGTTVFFEMIAAGISACF